MKADIFVGEILSRLSGMGIDEMSSLSQLINQTALAVNSYTIPFNFPTSLPAPAETGGLRARSPRRDRGGPSSQRRARSRSRQRNPDARRLRSRSPFRQLAQPAEFKKIINYYATWHPRSDDERRTNSDQLEVRWFAQLGSRGDAELKMIQDELTTVYIDARNKGLLYQLCQEKEVLWEPEGERRSEALAQTTRPFDVVEHSGVQT